MPRRGVRSEMVNSIVAVFRAGRAFTRNSLTEARREFFPGHPRA